MVALKLVIGLTLLVAGAELLVRGAARLAAAFGIPALVIGLTIVAFGTSAPELSVSVIASLKGEASVAVGNVVGSNIFNVLAILGLTALVAPLRVDSQLVRLDVPAMIAVSLAVWWCCRGGNVSPFAGIVLLVTLAGYTLLLVWLARREGAATAEANAAETVPLGFRARGWDLLLIAMGLALLVWGSNWLVESAVTIAAWVGVSQLVIGLTVVAAGTSLPELATSLVAGLRGERDIAVGNVVGSCLFNLLGVLGAAAAISRGGVAVDPAAIAFDLPLMVAAAVLCLPIFLTGMEITRGEGALLLAYYLAYLAYVVLTATGSAWVPSFRAAMLWGVLPVTGSTLLAFVLRDLSLSSRRRK